MKTSPRATSSPRHAGRFEPGSNRAVAFNLAGGGGAWLLHLLLSYVAAEFGCLAGLGQVKVAGLTVVAWLLLTLTVVMLAVASAAVVVSWQLGRHRPGDDTTRLAEARQAQRFSGRLGLVANSVFMLIIAIQSVPIFYFWRGC
jgi:hypothetical protein